MLLDYKKIVVIGEQAEAVADAIRSLNTGLDVVAQNPPEEPDGGLYVISREDWNYEWNAYCVHEFIDPVVIDPSDRKKAEQLISACL